jgi:hypothetical protein
VIALCRGIMLRRNVAAHRVLGHSDVAPARKKDPGEKFPWHSLANSGVGHWVTPAPVVRGESLMLGTISDEVLSLQQALARYGYGVPLTGKYDAATMEVVTAFQRHFRPARLDGCRGSLDAVDIAGAAREPAGGCDGESRRSKWRTPSLRAQRSNPDCLGGNSLDCFVASLLAMTECVATTPSPASVAHTAAAAVQLRRRRRRDIRLARLVLAPSRRNRSARTAGNSS